MHLKVEEEERVRAVEGWVRASEQGAGTLEESNSWDSETQPSLCNHNICEQSQYLTYGKKCLSGRKSTFHDLNHNTEIVKKNKLNLKKIFFLNKNTGGRKKIQVHWLLEKT